MIPSSGWDESDKDIGSTVVKEGNNNFRDLALSMGKRSRIRRAARIIPLRKGAVL
jgi:hypothetical protein